MKTRILAIAAGFAVLTLGACGEGLDYRVDRSDAVEGLLAWFP